MAMSDLLNVFKELSLRGSVGNNHPNDDEDVRGTRAALENSIISMRRKRSGIIKENRSA